MTTIYATLMNHTPLQICSHAVRTCWQSHAKADAGGEADRALILKVGNIFKHSSTLEHLNYTFYLENISRALLQELARHRIASLSVKSTRYTLKELNNEPDIELHDWESIERYCVLTENYHVNNAIAEALVRLQWLVKEGIPNDQSKFALPDAYKTELTWTINARSLQNFLTLRTSKAAMWEIRRLAYAIFDALPEDHKYLFQDFVEQKR